MNLRATRHGNELKGQCPFTELHANGQDNNPSFTINLERGVYYCNACGSKGNVHTFYAHFHKLDKRTAWFELGDALGLERPTDIDSRIGIDPGLPAQYYKALIENTGFIRDYLRDKRGIKDETLKRFLIGWDGDRVTIPIYDEYNDLVNIRRYKWNSYEDSYKMTNFTDELENAYGEDRVYGIEHLYDKSVKEIVWCEGEWDRILAEQNGFKVCTSTCGAENFRYEWIKLLKEKDCVWVCYDNDDTGKRATNYLVDNLKKSTALKLANWNDEYKQKCDITDLFVSLHFTPEQFSGFFIDYSESDADIPMVPLAASSNAKYAGRRIKIPVLVAGKENAPFLYPKHVSIRCLVGEDDEGKACASCRLHTTKKSEVDYTADDTELLKVIGCSDEEQAAAIKRRCGVPTKCFRPEIDIKEFGNLEVAHIIPKADANFGFAARHEYVARNGYVMGDNLPTNKRYTLLGYMHADPKTQRATYVFDEAIPEKDLLDELEVTPEIHKALLAFQCAEGQSVLSKFNEIHADLERNVTYIWDRRKVAFATDLVFHTALNFCFQEQMVKRGWAECLIIGDSGQAKTTVVERLMGHYKCGELLSGESSKRTGLVYNIQQAGSKGQWSLMWGAMPLNDGGLLCVDELSGMAEDDLAKMSDVRSSGIAKATGVVTAETTSRTRMIFISNPRNGRQLKAENYGVMSILKLFGKAEDVRRLDFAVGVASGEVEADIVNKAISDMPAVEHRYTSELCKTRVLWAWSRRPEQITFTEDAVTLILEQAGRMGKKYSSRVPLVEPADQRLKIARLAVSAAICVYSTDDGTNVIVKPEHVEFVVKYLEEQYDGKALNYVKLSADDFENSNTDDASMTRIRLKYIGIPFVSRTVNEVTRCLYQLNYFNRNTLEDATGLDRDEIKELMHFMLSSSIAEKAGTDYKRTPLGLAFIEYMLQEPPSDEEVRAARQQRFQNSEI